MSNSSHRDPGKRELRAVIPVPHPDAKPVAGRPFLFTVSLLLLVGCNLFLGFAGPIGKGGSLYAGVYFCAFLSLLGVWRLWPLEKGTVSAILILAALARVAFWTFPTGDDVNRYVWEGKIQNHGFNPYLFAPLAPELEHLRDDNWEGINHKHVPAIYPPLTQGVFRLLWTVCPHPHGFRLAFSILDWVLVAVLLLFCRSLKWDLRNALLYALNPLALVFISGEGHLDILYLLPLWIGFWAWKKGRVSLSFLCMALAIQAKIVPLVFVPFFLNRQSIKKIWVLLVPFLISVPYWKGGASLVDTFALFSLHFIYNGLFFALLSPWIGTWLASWTCWAIFSLAWISVFFLTPNPFRAAFVASGFLILCSPVVHQWYFLLVAAFVPFFPSRAWILLTGTVAATFATKINLHATGKWIDYPWAKWFEYGPFAGLGIWDLFSGKRTHPRSVRIPETVSVVIPCLNEEEQIEACIKSVQSQERFTPELIVVDGGSTDATRDKLKRMQEVRVVDGGGGRGGQILEGIRKATGDVVVILHADCRMMPGALARMRMALERNPGAVGGAFGLRYDNGLTRYRLIETLNNFRAALLGISFGDQAQFILRREIGPLFPDFALMEDVELSLRMKQEGAVLGVPKGVLISTRRWEKRGYGSNMLKVLWLVFVFVVSRRLGTNLKKGTWFYRAYYGKPC